MTPLVIDSSVAAKWVLDEADSPLADRIWDEATACRVHLLAPDFIDLEVANILWKNSRRGIITETRAADLLGEFQRADFERVPGGPLIGKALHLAQEYDRTVYDSLYLALSEREACPFVTADERLVNAVAPPLAGPVTLEHWAAANPPPPAAPSPAAP